MLGNCIIRNPRAADGTLDRGVICESLLFFAKTHLVIDFNTLALVIKGGFLDDLIEMLKRGYLTANYSPEMCGLHTDTRVRPTEHIFIIFKITGHQKTGTFKRNVEILEYELEHILRDKAKARFYHRELSKLVSFEDFADDTISEIAREDIRNPVFARQLAEMTLRNKRIPQDAIQFRFIEAYKMTGNKFAINTDINFDALRRYLPEPDRAAFGKADLFAGLLDGRLDVHLAAKFNSALVGNESNQTIVEMILKRSVGRKFDAHAFERAIYDFISVDTPRVREIINSNGRTPREFMSLLDSADVFRKWLGTQNPEADLIREMLREKTNVGWLESIPVKALRFGIFTGLGMLGDVVAPGTSVALGGFDALVVDKLANRWRPHYFVEHNLKGFLDIESPPSGTSAFTGQS